MRFAIAATVLLLSGCASTGLTPKNGQRHDVSLRETSARAVTCITRNWGRLDYEYTSALIPRGDGIFEIHLRIGARINAVIEVRPMHSSAVATSYWDDTGANWPAKVFADC